MPTADTADPAGGTFRFQGWELRPQERLLLVQGSAVEIGSRAFDVLLALATHRGRVMSKGELLDAAWPGLVVEENNISVQISTLRKLLGAKAITTVPGFGYQLCVAIEAPVPAQAAAAVATAREPERPAPGASSASALPELIGRQQDLDEVLERMSRSRFVTITGPGGVGKTTLAREAFARRNAIDPPPGHWIDLAPVRAARQVAGVLAEALGIELGDLPDGAEALAEAMSHLATLVVLDNCEHLADEVARIVRLALPLAPHVRWLATSQEALGVSGEALHRLAPLSVPDQRMSLAKALDFGAIALLCKRVVEADHRFRLDDASTEAAIDLCRQLDGLPLAIEMAAARVATFGLDEVRRRLGQRLRLLTAGERPGAARYSALQEMYDWSHGLLSPAEQAVFRRLGPFLGGFRADLVQQVASDVQEGGGIDAWQALDALGALIDKSLVQRTPNEPGRFHLLESARVYALARLQDAGETEATLRRHAHAMAAWFADAQSDADRLTDAQWIRHYAPERHNARAALAWAVKHDAPDDLAVLVTAYTLMDWLLCRQAEILSCEVPLERLSMAEPRKRACAYLELGWALFSDGNHALGAELSQSALETFTQLGDTALAYRALGQLTRLYETQLSMADKARELHARMKQVDDRLVPLRTRLFCAVSAGLLYRPELTIERTEDLYRLAAESGYDAVAAICACNLTDKLLVAGRYAEVVDKVDALLERTGHLARASAFMLHNKAAALIRLDRVPEAYEPAHLAFHAMPGVAHFLVDTFALAAVRENRLADAAVLHGCGTRVREDLHEQPDVSEAAGIAETAAALEAGMEATQRAELMALGAAMTAREALAIKVFPRGPSALPDDAMGAGTAGARGRASSLDAA